MALIKLKFSPEMEELVLQGKKCCTTRDEKKGEIGDIFRVKDRLYRILQVDECDLEYASVMAPSEGFESDVEFIDTILEIYPELCSCDTVYIHFFAYVGDWCPQFGIVGAACNEEVCELSSICCCVDVRKVNGS